MAMIMMLASVIAVTGKVRASEPMEAGKLFAGFYSDSTFTTPLSSETGTAVPKYVDEAVLTVRFQLTKNVNETSDETRLRAVTTVDSTHYRKAGFFVTVGSGAEREYSTVNVARRITGTDGLTTLSYDPSVFSEESEYFCAFNFTVANDKFSVPLTFTPFWVTPDGTEVRGKTRTLIISESEPYNNYLISNAAEFRAFAEESKTRNFAGWKVKLISDIDLNPGCIAGDDGMSGTPAAWTPIGNVNLPFNGTFDGQGHTVSGVYLNNTDRYQGLFSGTGPQAVIKNFSLKNSFFSSTGDQLGSVAGNAMGRFENIYSEAIVKGYCNHVGGLIGASSSAGAVFVTDCWFAGSATIESAKSYLGGLLGLNQHSDTRIENSMNTGHIYHRYPVQTPGTGGFVGYAAYPLTLIDSVNHPKILYTSGNENSWKTVGFLIGRADSVTVTNCHSIYYPGGFLVNGNNDSYPTCTRQRVADVAGARSLTVAKVLNLFTSNSAKGHWVCSNDSLPVLTAFADLYAPGTLKTDFSWYDASFSEYTLADLGDLLGFTELSKTNSFAGKTVKLGADITINYNMSNPTMEWPGIGSGSVRFAGTFDGQGHTLSGPLNGATVRNLRLKDSVFSYTGTDGSEAAGAITGRMNGGRIENVYTEAKVTSSGSGTAGIVGIHEGNQLTLSNVWNAGNITSSNPNTGGLVAETYGTLIIENSLNTGDIETTTETSPANIGGLLGYGDPNIIIRISYSVNTGAVRVGAESGFGLIAGNINGHKSYFTSLASVSTDGVGSYNTSASTPNVTVLKDAGSFTGESPLYSVPGLFLPESVSGISRWSLVCGKTAVPTVFSDLYGNEAVYVRSDSSEMTGWEADDADTALLEALYSGRKLYQGELHDHADTSVGSSAGTSDGYVEIDKWYDQMEELGMDFAASLDHCQASHIDVPEWDKSKLIYGSEASSSIPSKIGGRNTFHYDMLFKTKEQFESVLNAFPKFRYLNPSNGNVSWTENLDPEHWPDRTNNGRKEFVYWNATRAEFKSLIQTVQAAGGFFNMPHPLTYATNNGNVDDYYFDVPGIGFHVFYGDRSYDTRMYDAWRELLAKGYRVYATAGYDVHKNLSNKCLTSIYGPLSADIDKGDLIQVLSSGDFAAGSAGIRMCVGNTTMGGETSFTGKRVVIDVDAVHTQVNEPSHRYRIDVISDRGVIFSREFAVGQDGSMPGVEIAFDADDSVSFYRTVLSDMTTSRRVAVGNPIWNK